jgi:hypothetical protein
MQEIRPKDLVENRKGSETYLSSTHPRSYGVTHLSLFAKTNEKHMQEVRSKDSYKKL